MASQAMLSLVAIGVCVVGLVIIDKLDAKLYPRSTKSATIPKNETDSTLEDFWSHDMEVKDDIG